MRSESIPPPPMDRTGGALIKDGTDQDITIRGLENYFAQFDQFVRETAAETLVDAMTLMKSYEASEFCPMGKFCGYLPYGENARLRVVQNRYNRLLGKCVDL